MLSFSDFFIFETASQDLGGVITRTTTTVAVPIPGAGIILSPVASTCGETIGKAIPIKKVPDVMKDSVEIYKSGGRGKHII